MGLNLNQPAATLRTSRNAWPIFISYRRSDLTREIAVWLKEQLERETIEANTGQIFGLDVFVDAAEAYRSDFQANLVPHLQHSRALIVLADEGAATPKPEGATDYLYQELDWWAATRSKTPPIILQLDVKSALSLVQIARYGRWRKVNFIDCFWEKWLQAGSAGVDEKTRLLSKLRESIRNYGQVIHLEEVRRLKRRAAIAWTFAVVALVAGAIAALFANYYATAKITAERNEQSAKRSAALSDYRVANDLRKRDPRASLAYLSAANHLTPQNTGLRAALDLALHDGGWPHGFFQQLESSTLSVCQDKKSHLVAASTMSDGVYVWDELHQTQVGHLAADGATVRKVRFLPDGRLFLASGKEQWTDKRPWFVENRTRAIQLDKKTAPWEIPIPEGYSIVDLFNKDAR
jgi:hypothetical protein